MQPRCHPHDDDDPLGRLAAAAALAALLSVAFRAWFNTHARRCGGRSACAPVAENTWEGEGGRPLTEPPSR